MGASLQQMTRQRKNMSKSLESIDRMPLSKPWKRSLVSNIRIERSMTEKAIWLNRFILEIMEIKKSIITEKMENMSIYTDGKKEESRSGTPER